MTVDVATLGLNVDTSKLKQAERAQDQFGKSAENMERRTKRSADGINASFDGLSRAAKSAADAADTFGNEIESLKRRFDPVYSASKKYEAALNDLNRAHQIGAISAQTHQANLQAMNMELANGGNHVNAFGKSVGSANGMLTNMVFQFQDIAMMMASGQNPLMLAMQQGSQISGIFMQAGGGIKQAGSLIAGAFMGLLSPVSLLTVGVIAAGAALVQWGMSAIGGSKDAQTFRDAIDQTQDSINALRDVTDLYSQEGLTTLAEKYGFVSQRVKDLVDAQRILAEQQAVSDLQTALDAITAGLGEGLFTTKVGELASAFETTSDRARGLLSVMNGIADLPTVDRQLEVIRRLKEELSAVTNGFTDMSSEQVTVLRLLTEAEDQALQLKAAAPGPGWMGSAIGETNLLIGRLIKAEDAARDVAQANRALAAMKVEFSPGGQAMAKYGGRGTVSDAPVLLATADALKEVDYAASGKGGGKGGAAGALTEAEEAAKKLREEMERPLISAIDGVSNAFGDFVMRGFRDFKGFTKSIVNSFKSMLAQMISMAIKNRIMIGLGLGGTVSGVANAATSAGALGGVGSIIGGFGTGAGLSGLAGGTGLLGGFGNVVGGFASGGFAGAGSALGTALGGATSGLAGFAGAVGAIAAPLLAVGAIFSFFKKKTTELDSGLNVTVGNLSAAVETFRTIETKRFFGLSKKVSTSTGAASAEVADPIVKSVTEIQQSILTAAEAFGFGADAFAGFSYQFNLSLKGLTQEQALQKVNEELAKMGDAFAGMLPQFSSMNELLEAHSQRIQLEDRLLQLQGKSAELLARQRERELLATHELNRPLLMQIHALEDQAQAAQNAANQMERLMQSNLFESSAERQFAATSFGFTRPMMTQMSEEERALMREIVTAIREGDINQARLTNRLVQMQERQELEPTA